MRTENLAILLLAAASIAPAFTVLSADPAGADGEDAYHPTRVNIGFVGAIPSDVATRVTLHGGRILGRTDGLQLVRAEVLPGTDRDQFIDAMKTYSDIRYAFPEVILTLAFAPNDANYFQQWGPKRIGAEAAWEHGLGTHAIKVGIIDQGVDCQQEDLAANCDPANEPQPASEHGTAVAGIVGAVTNNAIGVAGLSQSVIWSAKQSADPVPDGGLVLLGQDSDQILAAIAKGVDVINMSFVVKAGLCGVLAPPVPGVLDACEPLRNAIKTAHDAGVLLVASSGNGDSDFVPGCDVPVGYPAADPLVIGVGAGYLLPDGHAVQRVGTSQCGVALDLTAPGESIETTQPQNAYGRATGTSVAAPHVAGVAALVWSSCPGLSNDELTGILEATAEDLGPVGRDDEYGYGLVRADSALNAALAHPHCGGV